MNKKSFFKLSFVLTVAATSFLGCGGEVEKNVDTAKMITEFSLTRNLKTVTCKAKFWESVRKLPNIELSGGDQVWCQGNMMVKKQGNIGEIWYETDVALEQNLEYLISFKRPGEDPYVARVTVPESIQILQPLQKVIGPGRDIYVEVKVGERDLDQTLMRFEKNEDGINEPHSQRKTGKVSTFTIDKKYTEVRSKAGAVANITVWRIREGMQPKGLSGATQGFSTDSVFFELH